jgi:hypothetical protein
MNTRLIALRNWLALRLLSRRRIFGLIHDEGLWRGDESVSGMGSNLANTRRVREALPALLSTIGVRSMLDLPCGDCHWMRHVPLEGVLYIGADIVPALVERTAQAWPGEERRFMTLDLCSDALPAVDLLFCRDALVHLSDVDLRRALRNIRRSPIRYLLTTHFRDTNRKNTPIHTGEWRPLCLTGAPWHFPSPLQIIDEGYLGEGGQFADKCLALWRVDSLPTG